MTRSPSVPTAPGRGGGAAARAPSRGEPRPSGPTRCFCFWSASRTLAAVIGVSSNRTPIASYTAFAIAGGTGLSGASPAPHVAPPLDLPLRARRVEGAAAVVGRRDPVHGHHARLEVDAHLGYRGLVRVRRARPDAGTLVVAADALRRLVRADRDERPVLPLRQHRRP